MNKQVILITGASSGIGKETARKLLSEGQIVYAAARRLDQMRDLQEAGAIIVQLDISKEEEIRACMDKVISEQGRIDVLFNNAGFGLYGSVEEVSLDDARYQFEVNLFGLARMTQLVVPYMREQRNGKIINTSSVGGKIYTPLGAWYHASKHALEGWSDCLRLELQPFGIDVIILEPGIIETSFGDVMSEPMMRYSGNGPYRDLAKKIANTTRKSYRAGGGSPAHLVANIVAKSIATSNPQIRYAVGKMAKPLILLRKWISDKNFDRLIMSQMK